jgi:hypothetical protein
VETSFLVKAAQFPMERGGKIGPVGCARAVELCRQMVQAGKSSESNECAPLLGPIFMQALEMVPEPVYYSCPKCGTSI